MIGSAITDLVYGLLFGVAAMFFGMRSWPWVSRKTVTIFQEYIGYMVGIFDRMFLTVTPRQCLAMILLSTGFGLAVAIWMTRFLPPGVIPNIVRVLVFLALVWGPGKVPSGWKLPRKIVDWMWQRRIQKFDEQTIDALTMMAAGLKAGLSPLQSMQLIVQEMPNPVSQEFALVISQQNLGVRFEQALLNLEERIQSDDIRIAVTAINILRESGGNLAEVFETLADTMRQRHKVEAKIRAITSQGVTQGYVITGLPFGLVYVLYLIEPTMMRLLWTTSIGFVILGIMIFFQWVGFKIITKITAIEV